MCYTGMEENFLNYFQNQLGLENKSDVEAEVET